MTDYLDEAFERAWGELPDSLRVQVLDKRAGRVLFFSGAKFAADKCAQFLDEVFGPKQANAAEAATDVGADR